MSLTKSQLIIFGSVGLIVLLLALVFLGVIPGLKSKNQPQAAKAQIQIWGVFDSNRDYDTAFQNIQKIYPQVTLTYRAFSDANDYESTLLDALAAGRGPDIFMIRNNALPKEIDKILPAPQTLLPLTKLESLFPQVVEQDFSSQNSVYALPLSIDTLALIYNRDIFDQAAVTTLPQTWQDLIKDVPALVKIVNDKISRAAVALGGGANIGNAVDILNLLMLQSGTKMTSPDFKSATFASNEGLNALSFYAQFGLAGNKNYTWNSSLPNTLDLFSQGNLAVMLDYESALPQIKARNPFLNFGILPMLQPENSQQSVTYPNYWGFAVSRQSRNASLAWNIIVTLTTDPPTAKSYLLSNGKPPALRSLINDYANDPVLGVFAKQVLIARSWSEADPSAIQAVFLQTINSVLAGADPTATLHNAQDQVTRIMGGGL